MGANDYDAIVIGGGHNGLVSAAYLRSRKRTVGRASFRGRWRSRHRAAVCPDYKVTMCRTW